MRKSIVLFETVVAVLSIVLWGVMLAMSLDITYPNSAQFLTGGRIVPLSSERTFDPPKRHLGH